MTLNIENLTNELKGKHSGYTYRAIFANFIDETETLRKVDLVMQILDKSTAAYKIRTTVKMLSHPSPEEEVRNSWRAGTFAEIAEAVRCGLEG